MQLGMVGLGRMGANLVRRLMRDGHRRVTARAVENGGERAGVHETVLLRERRLRRQRDLHFTARDRHQPRAERVHQALGGEAVGDALVEVGHGGDASAFAHRPPRR